MFMQQVRLSNKLYSNLNRGVYLKSGDEKEQLGDSNDKIVVSYMTYK